MNQKLIDVVLKKASKLIGESNCQIVKDLFEEEIKRQYKKECKTRKGMLKAFITAKKVEGCSERTIGYYKYTINKFILETTTPLSDVTTEEIRSYLSDMLEKKKVSNQSAETLEEFCLHFFHGYLRKTIFKKIQ